MPVTPQQVRQARLNDKSFKRVLERIDEALLNETHFPMTFSVELIESIPVEEVVDMYNNSGWRVTLVADWRDGDYLRFEVA